MIHVNAACTPEKISKMPLKVLHSQDEEGWSVLHYAAHNGAHEIIDALIKKSGFNMNQRTNSGETAIDLAVKCCSNQSDRRTIKQLDEAGCMSGAEFRENRVFGYIHHDAFHKNHERVQGFIELGVDPNAFNSQGERPLHAAARGGSASIIKLLLDSGADPLLKDRRGQLPLRVAIEAGKASEHDGDEIYDLFMAHMTKPSDPSISDDVLDDRLYEAFFDFWPCIHAPKSAEKDRSRSPDCVKEFPSPPGSRF
jgi:ankyrin repeat protein